MDLRCPLLAFGHGDVQIGNLTLSHRSVNRFNSREVARALKAARLAGECPDRVEIDPATGRIAVIIRNPGETTTGNNANPWDEVLKDDANARRPT
jgi:hypothetical protein